MSSKDPPTRASTDRSAAVSNKKGNNTHYTHTHKNEELKKRFWRKRSQRALVLASAVARLQVDLTRYGIDGTYQLQTTDGSLWLQSGPLGLHTDQGWLSTDADSNSGGVLTLANSQNVSGCDRLGCYWAIVNTWQHNNVPVVETAIAAYPQREGLYGFETIYLTPVTNASTGNNADPSTCFPSFQLHSGRAPDLNLLYQHHIFGNVVRQQGLGNLSSDVEGGVPLVLYEDPTTAQAPGAPITDVAVLSPFNHLKVAIHSTTSSHAPNTFCGGLNGMTLEIPINTSIKFLLATHTEGLHAGLQTWGDALLLQGNKTRSADAQDVTATALSAWTDNGAYYYYWMDQSHSYQQTLIDYADYHRKVNLPVQSYQLDSWWYYKYLEFDGGLERWEPRPQVFPGGIEAVQVGVRKPLTLHNRWWSSHNVYQEKFQFATQGLGAIPIGSVDEVAALFGYIMRNHSAWGLAVYEQDWLTNQFKMMDVAKSNLTVAWNWLAGMAQAASARHVRVQYCMPLPSDFLASTQFPAVTQIRVSNDYASDPYNQWKIGAPSLFAWAMGLRPFKDVFRTTTFEPLNFDLAPEYNPEMQAAVATLSTGPVAIGDMINMTNITIVNRTMMANGTILSPNRPATSLEVSFTTHAPAGEVWAAPAGPNITAPQQLVVFVGDLLTAFELELGMLRDLEASGQFLVQHWTPALNAAPLHFNASQSLRLPANHLNSTDHVGFDLYVITPYPAGGIAVLGEVGKYVPLSARRFVEVQAYATGATAHMVGTAGEILRVAAWIHGRVIVQECIVAQDDQIVSVVFSAQGGQCD
ncbi:uncharacterized protein MONBRDRAFT_22026 [Monosiga brevicollis MX1]|uniref:Uncharacterized protein n=1 Tax=Monosiga brevicollis TaxID=81824 RepID=A9UPB7_MONBE|nr:uncharacterized protein MONBRDRAFT_22026 [Monosiga brevicollis MX1]EDQ92389.1 predicted protein [Monosiga brevicollis MX1]|eukprot:XP_001742151.1 hypothetical protein [Monosiga brevicollis MX1]